MKAIPLRDKSKAEAEVIKLETETKQSKATNKRIKERYISLFIILIFLHPEIKVTKKENNNLNCRTFYLVVIPIYHFVLSYYHFTFVKTVLFIT